MKKTIFYSVVSLAAAKAAGDNNQPQVGFFDSEDTVNRLRTESPNSIQGEVRSFTINTDVTNDLTVWSRDDVQQLIQENHLTEA